MKKFFIALLFGLTLFFTSCSKDSGHYYTSLYTFRDELKEIVASDRDQIVEIDVFRLFDMADFPTFADIEIVADGTTAIENIDYVLSGKRADFKDKKIPGSVVITLTCYPSFIKGKTLKLRLRYDEHPHIVAHMMDTVVITAK